MRLSKYLIAVGAVVAAVPANAVGPNRDSLDAQYARKVLQNFAQCTVKLDHDLSRRFVLNGRGAITDEEFLRLADSRCLAIVPKLHMRQWQYRAALAQELIRRDLAASAVLNPRGVMPLTWTPLMVSLTNLRTGKPLTAREARVLRTELALQATGTFLEQLGECIVRASPSGAKSVLDTKIDSDDEVLALKAVASHVPGCVPAGQKVELTRTSVRHGIALSYYRLANQPIAPVQEAAK